MMGVHEQRFGGMPSDPRVNVNRRVKGEDGDRIKTGRRQSGIFSLAANERANRSGRILGDRYVRVARVGDKPLSEVRGG